MSMFLAGKLRNSKQPKGMCTLKIPPHSFIAETLTAQPKLSVIKKGKEIRHERPPEAPEMCCKDEEAVDIIGLGVLRVRVWDFVW